MKLRCLILMIVISALCSGGRAYADGLEAGLWQVITRNEVNGAAAPPQQTSRCLKPDDVNNLDLTFSPQATTINSTCERPEHEFTPTRLKWRLVCTGQLDMEVAGEFQFDARDHYTAVVMAKSAMGGRTVGLTKSVIEGKRVGECP